MGPPSPEKCSGTGHFLVGATYVRPLVPLSEGTPIRLGRDQNVDVWMQDYELGVHEKTNKAYATVEYDIASTDRNDSVIHRLESADQMENIGKQITLKKTLPAANLQPYAYKLRVKVHDNISNEVLTGQQHSPLSRTLGVISEESPDRRASMLLARGGHRHRTTSRPCTDPSPIIEGSYYSDTRLDAERVVQELRPGPASIWLGCEL